MSTTTSLGIGVVGCGNIAFWQHLRSLRSLSGVKIVGLTDPDAAALSRARRSCDAEVFEDIDALLQSDRVAAVVIASPNAFHAPQALAACHAGKHVYVEKPFATAEAEALELVDASRTSGVHLACGFNFRFHPVCQRARELLRRNVIGPPRAVVSSFTENLPLSQMPAWKRERCSGGGVLLDLGSHHFDLVRWLLDDELQTVLAHGDSLRSEMDGIHVIFQMGSGVPMAGHYRFTASRTNELELHGELGVLRLDLHRARLSLSAPRARGYGVTWRTAWPWTADLSFRAIKRLRPAYDPSFRRAMAAFVGSIEGNECESSALADATDGLHAIQAVLAAERAHRLGTVTTVGKEASCES